MKLVKISPSTLELNQPVYYRVPNLHRTWVEQMPARVAKIEKDSKGAPVLVLVQSLMSDKAYWTSPINLFATAR